MTKIVIHLPAILEASSVTATCELHICYFIKSYLEQLGLV